MRDIKFRAWIPNTKTGKGHLIIINNEEIDELIEEGCAVMQFTGLQDSKGVDIYEGDILSDKWKAVVYFKNGSYWVTINIGENDDQYLQGFIGSRKQAKCPVDVIGNIYENPELLAQEKNDD